MCVAFPPAISANVGSPATSPTTRKAPLPSLVKLQGQVKNNPRDPNLRAMLGLRLARTGSLDSAIEEFRQAVALKPDFIKAWTNLATASNRKAI